MRLNFLLSFISVITGLLFVYLSIAYADFYFILFGLFYLCFAFAFFVNISFFGMIFVFFQMAFLSAGYFITRGRYEYSHEIILMYLVGIFITLVIFFFLPRDKRSLDPIIFERGGFLHFSIAVSLFFMTFAIYGDNFSGSNRNLYQANVGSISLLFKGLALYCVFKTYNRNKFVAFGSIVAACAVFALVTLSRSQSLQPLIVFALLRYGQKVPSFAIVLMSGLILTSMYIVSTLRGIEQQVLQNTFFYTISDPNATHAFYADPSPFNFGRYFFEYFYRLVPREFWPDKPLVIGFGRSTVLNDNSRTPGLIVEGYRSFGYVGGFIYLPLFALFYYSIGRMISAEGLRPIKVISILFCSDILTSGRAIFSKVPYQFVEYGIVAFVIVMVSILFSTVRIFTQRKS